MEKEIEVVEIVDDDCCEIDAAKFPQKVGQVTEDITVIAEKGPVALKDYPHPRHLCGNFRFATTSHENCCSKCYCVVCDTPALTCQKWKGSDGHFEVVDDDEAKSLSMKQLIPYLGEVISVMEDKSSWDSDSDDDEAKGLFMQYLIRFIMEALSVMEKEKGNKENIEKEDEDDDYIAAKGLCMQNLIPFLTEVFSIMEKEEDNEYKIEIIDESDDDDDDHNNCDDYDKAKNLFIQNLIPRLQQALSIMKEEDGKKNNVTVEENDDEDANDCYEIDSSEFLRRKLDLNVSEDVVLVAEKEPVALKDFCHPRYLCGNFPFNSTSHESYCRKCFCSVCQVAAPCLNWKGANGHSF